MRRNVVLRQWRQRDSGELRWALPIPNEIPHGARWYIDGSGYEAALSQVAATGFALALALFGDATGAIAAAVVSHAGRLRQLRASLVVSSEW